MTFKKGTKEWSMYGDLYQLLKSAKGKGKSYELYLECAKFGEKYKELPLAHKFAWELLFIDRKECPDTEDGTEKITYEMFRHFYKLNEQYYDPFVADTRDDEYIEDIFWEDAIRNFNQFLEEHIKTEEFPLFYQWSMDYLAFIDAKFKEKKEKKACAQ